MIRDTWRECQPPGPKGRMNTRRGGGSTHSHTARRTGLDPLAEVWPLSSRDEAADSLINKSVRRLKVRHGRREMVRTEKHWGRTGGERRSGLFSKHAYTHTPPSTVPARVDARKRDTKRGGPLAPPLALVVVVGVIGLYSSVPRPDHGPESYTAAHAPRPCASHAHHAHTTPQHTKAMLPSSPNPSSASPLHAGAAP